MARSLFDKILQVVNMGFALALLLSYASLYISPTVFWHPAFFGLAYPYLLCANLFFLFYWTTRFHVSLMISLFVILAGCGLIARFVQVPFLKPGLPTIHQDKTIAALSYNVRGLFFMNQAGERIPGDTLLAFLDHSPMQILCLQEFPTLKAESYAQNLSSMLDAKVSVHMDTPDDHTSGTGNATFSTFPIVGKGKIDIDKASNLCIYTDLKIGKDTFRVYNCHLHSNRLIHNDLKFVENVGKVYDKQQIESLKEITLKLKKAYEIRSRQVDTLASHIAASPYKVLVFGDFNDTPVSYAYKKIRNNLSDAFIKAGLWTSPTYRKGFVAFRIDFIFCDPEFSVMDYRCEPYALSDHYPVFCRLSFPQ